VERNQLVEKEGIVKVTLIAHTPGPDRLAAVAARVCYSHQGAEEIIESIENNTIERRVKVCVEKGHHSVLEHAVFTFSIEGISRVTSHQLVRHRIASYSQQSQRYVKMKGEEPEYVTPPSVAERFSFNFERTMEYCYKTYQAMLKDGIPSEDARYILPSAMCTNILVTMNARELLHFFKLRCDKAAQWEIREMACKMRKLVREVAPVIFEEGE